MNSVKALLWIYDKMPGPANAASYGCSKIAKLATKQQRCCTVKDFDEKMRQKETLQYTKKSGDFIALPTASFVMEFKQIVLFRGFSGLNFFEKRI